MKETCANCEGTGFIRCEHCGGHKGEPDLSLLDEDCRKCAGTGKARCPQCGGTGFLREEVLDRFLTIHQLDPSVCRDDTRQGKVNS